MVVYVQLVSEHYDPSVAALPVLLLQDGHGLVHLAKGALPKLHENQTLVLVLLTVVT